MGVLDGDVVFDSKEGIAILIDSAKRHGFGIYESHERIAKKHGVATDGVVVFRPIPVEPEARHVYHRSATSWDKRNGLRHYEWPDEVKK